MSSLSQTLRKIQVVHPAGTYAVDQWTAPDLVPMDKSRRTWGAFSYAIFWLTGGFAIYNYTTGSAIISYGLNARQALAVGVVSPVILAALVIICGVSLSQTTSLLFSKDQALGC